MALPPFPVDDATLDLLMAAMDPRGHGDPEAESSSVWPFLTMLSQLGGSDTEAVKEVTDDGIHVMRDPHYHDHDVIAALVAEVRRLRALLDPGTLAGVQPYGIPQPEDPGVLTGGQLCGGSGQLFERRCPGCPDCRPKEPGR